MSPQKFYEMTLMFLISNLAHFGKTGFQTQEHSDAKNQVLHWLYAHLGSAWRAMFVAGGSCPGRFRNIWGVFAAQRSLSSNLGAAFFEGGNKQK